MLYCHVPKLFHRQEKKWHDSLFLIWIFRGLLTWQPWNSTRPSERRAFEYKLMEHGTREPRVCELLHTYKNTYIRTRIFNAYLIHTTVFYEWTILYTLHTSTHFNTPSVWFSVIFLRRIMPNNSPNVVMLTLIDLRKITSWGNLLLWAKRDQKFVQKYSFETTKNVSQVNTYHNYKADFCWSSNNF